MDENGYGPPVPIPLKAKYTQPKPHGRFRADYAGNSGSKRHKGGRHPAIHGINRKRARSGGLHIR